MSGLAKEALLDEVMATPKPGLVDRNNNGSHKDMSVETFVRSANALEGYFYKITEYGFDSHCLSESEVFSNARQLGIEAERDMLCATDGVNTHKGAIFSCGLVCLAVGRLYADGGNISLTSICKTVADLVNGICESDYNEARQKNNMSNGEKIFCEYGIKGSRGEAESGFLSVREYAYPFLNDCLKKGMDKNEALVRTLLNIMSKVEDTNVIKRGGLSAAQYVKERSGELIFSSFEIIEKFDKELISKNVSAGGCADLLAVAWLIYNIEKSI